MSLKKIMKGVYLTGHGGFDKLDYREDIPVPELENNEVLVKIHAAGVNNTDINTRIAWYSKSNQRGNSEELGSKGIDSAHNPDGSWGGSTIKFPRIQGIDACGEIVKVGAGVEKNRVGERVLISPCMKINSQYIFLGSEINGSFAEYTKVQSEFAYKVTSDLVSEQLSSFPCSYSTAENMLTRTKLKKDEHILITGASGGVGSACIQLAKRRGATITAMSSLSKIKDVNKLGADKIITHDQLKNIDNRSVDVVIDLLGKDYSNNLINKLKYFGRYATAGAVSGPIASIDIRTIYLHDLSLFGCTVLDSGVFKNIIGYIEKKEFIPLVDKIFPLKNIIEAQKYFLKKDFIGKIVITTY